ncbi:MAG TPA: hypothetical protein VJT67_15180 [Longimicrobiaceae bacterium]|nr:hypothetical protein [Longimicrobiaceae bacterium]
MKKLSLDMEALEVQSFEVGSAPARLGTVQGMGETAGCDSLRICGPDDPSYVSCEATCDLACTGSCGYTYCAGDCTHGQTNGETCAC